MPQAQTAAPGSNPGLSEPRTSNPHNSRESEDQDCDLVLPPQIPLPLAPGSLPAQQQGGDAQHGQQGVLGGQASLGEAQVGQGSQQPCPACT